MHTRHLPLVFILLISFMAVVGMLFPAFVMAQQCSDVTLGDAKKLYENGKFNEVIRMLNPCLDKGFNEKQKVEAFRLLAMTYIAIDSNDRAAVETGFLLQISPTYEANLFDPPAFIRLVNSTRLAGGAQVVTSVSKKAESIYEAPATIVVISRDDIV